MEILKTGNRWSPDTLLTNFSLTIRERLAENAKDPCVAGFKSVVCYRTGLDVSTVPDPAAEATALFDVYQHLQPDVPLRLADKPLNDLVVRTTLEVAAEYNKPGMAPFSFFLRLTVQCRIVSPFNLYLLQYSFIQVLATPISH